MNLVVHNIIHRARRIIYHSANGNAGIEVTRLRGLSQHLFLERNPAGPLLSLTLTALSLPSPARLQGQFRIVRHSPDLFIHVGDKRLDTILAVGHSLWCVKRRLPTD